MIKLQAISAVCVVLTAAGLCFAGEEEAQPKKKPIRIDREKKVIEIDGRICLEEGPLELFACAEGGKEYESLVALEGEPWQLHVSLLLLGLKTGGGPEFQGDPTAPYGSRLIIEIEWKEDDKVIRKRIEDLIYDTSLKDSMPHVLWVFIGSKFEKNEKGETYYVAGRDRSIITVFHDPYTVIDNPLESGGNDTTYVVNKKIAPPLNTPVTLIIRPGKIKPPDITKEE